jgi:hypothetical protein
MKALGYRRAPRSLPMDVAQRRTNPRPARAPSRALGWALAGAALLLVGGCRREEVTTYRVAKDLPAAAPAAPAGDALGTAHQAPAAPPPGMAGDVPLPPTPTGAQALKWNLPKGWSQSFPGGMRFATFKIPGTGKIDGSVVTLPGDAGGELPNVNRWRGQIGLPPTDAAGLAAARSTARSKLGPVNVYDFTSEGSKKSRLVAAILMVDGNAWFIKLTGDAEPVSAARPDFLRLLESLYRE